MPRSSKNNSNTTCKFSDFIEDGKPTETCWKYISNLAKAVVLKYFYKYTEYFDKDDLISSPEFKVEILMANETASTVANDNYRFTSLF